MEISEIIKRLIIVNGQVYINETGTLKTKYKPSELLPSGEFLPPTREIFFDENGEKDGLLKKELLKEGINEQEADAEIKKLSENIKNAIKKGEKFELQGLGYFQNGKDKKITFVQTAKESLLPDTIGFEPVKASVVSTSANKTTTNKTHTKKHEPKHPKTPQEKPKTKTTVKTTIPEKKDSKVTVQRKKKSALRWIVPLIILLGIIAGGIYYFNPLKSKISGLFAKNDNKVIDSIVNKPVDTDTVKFDIDPEYKKLLDAHIGSMQKVYLGDKYKKFYIIVGSFTDKNNAKQLQKQMKNMGYKSTILYVEGQTYYRVSIGEYNTADTIIPEFKKFTSKYGEDIWILVNKK